MDGRHEPLKMKFLVCYSITASFLVPLCGGFCPSPPSYLLTRLQRHLTDGSSVAELGAGGGASNDVPPEFMQQILESLNNVDVDEYGNFHFGGGGDSPGEASTDDSDSILVESGLASLRSFDLKPREVVEYLDRYVIQQRDAKRVLAVAICDHYNHCRRCLDGKQEEEDSFFYAKPNILLAGPTGVGKTYLLKTIARLIGVPFVKGDATKFSETGIVGQDADDLVRDLVSAAGGNTTLAEYGIIYIDEVDKIASGGGGDGGMSFSRGDLARGVQNNFLKLLEETDVPLQGNSPFELMGMGGGSRGGPKTINTRNILFIFSGAFTGLDAAMRRKKETKPFGLDLDGLDDSSPANRADKEGKKMKKRSYLSLASTKDWIDAGLEPEFVGRVPVRIALNSLDADDLKQILVQAEGSVLKQFVRDFAGYGINMTVTDEAITRVAEFAEEEATGARGLVTILERTLRGHKYELPSTSIRNFELDAKIVEEPGLALQALLSTQTEQDELFVRLDDLKRWERYANQLVDQYSIWLTDEAIDHMMNLSIIKGKKRSAYSLAREHFDALPDVVVRIGESTGQKQFPISLDMAKDPKAEIATWLSLIGPEEQTQNGASPNTDTHNSTDGSKKKKKIRDENEGNSSDPAPASTPASERNSDRETDLNKLVAPDSKAPEFCATLAKGLTFGAPGRFPTVEGLSAGKALEEFDLEKARELLREEANKIGLSDQDACEEFAKVVNCMIIDIIDLASSSLKEKDDKITVDAMNIVMDFMDHSAVLFEPFLTEDVSIKPVTYEGNLGRGKLEQLYTIYATSGMMCPGVSEDRIDMFRELFGIKEKKAGELFQKKIEDLAGMPGMDGEMSPEQIKEGRAAVNMMKELVESGNVSKEEMKLVKEQFKITYGIDMEEIIANADSGDIREQLGEEGEELLEMFQVILKATKD